MKYCKKCQNKIEEGDYCSYCGVPVVHEVTPKIDNNGDKKSLYSCLSAIFYPVLFVFIGLLIYQSTLGLIIGALSAVLSGVCIFIGGIYVLVIPLPYIFFYKIGVSSQKSSTLKAILWGLLAVLAIIGAFLSFTLI